MSNLKPCHFNPRTLEWFDYNNNRYAREQSPSGSYWWYDYDFTTNSLQNFNNEMMADHAELLKTLEEEYQKINNKVPIANGKVIRQEKEHPCTFFEGKISEIISKLHCMQKEGYQHITLIKNFDWRFSGEVIESEKKFLERIQFKLNELDDKDCARLRDILNEE
jgi:hypothetical protein